MCEGMHLNNLTLKLSACADLKGRGVRTPPPSLEMKIPTSYMSKHCMTLYIIVRLIDLQNHK